MAGSGKGAAGGAKGVTEALAELVNGYAKFADRKDAPYLLAIVVNTMVERGAVEEAHGLLSRCMGALSAKNRAWVDTAVNSERRRSPRLACGWTLRRGGSWNWGADCWSTTPAGN